MDIYIKAQSSKIVLYFLYTALYYLSGQTYKEQIWIHIFDTFDNI